MTADELPMLEEIAAAAADFDFILTALIRTGDTSIVSTDIGATALQARLQRLTDANKALEKHRGHSLRS